MRAGEKIILASGSPRRRELLAQMGYDYEVVPADVEEVTGGIPAEKLALTNARRKAEAVAKQYPDRCVLGADTVVVCDSMIFGKPANEADALRMLRALSGRKHQVITGVSVCAPDRQINFTEITDVTFKALSPDDIRQYMQLVHVMDKAGAYAIQEHAEIILDHFEGSFTNVIGLPTEHLESVLKEIQINP